MSDVRAVPRQATAIVPKSLRWPLVHLLRPKQWVKNGFVLAPLLFAGAFTDTGALVRALMAVVFFCAASSAIYVLNDLRDVETDRLHPKKCLTRPLAAGLVTPRQACGVMAALLLIVLTGFTVLPQSTSVIVGYLLLNTAYSFKLKSLPVIDLFCIALGFALRVLAGAWAIAVPLSNWMLITTLCLALYLAAIKRRQELRASGSNSRSVLKEYSLPLLDRYAEMAAISAVVFYGLFVTTTRPELALTLPVILFGLFRYWFLVDQREGGESPTDALWEDRTLAGTVALWVLLSGYALFPR